MLQPLLGLAPSGSVDTSPTSFFLNALPLLYPLLTILVAPALPFILDTEIRGILPKPYPSNSYIPNVPTLTAPTPAIPTCTVTQEVPTIALYCVFACTAVVLSASSRVLRKAGRPSARRPPAPPPPPPPPSPPHPTPAAQLPSPADSEEFGGSPPPPPPPSTLSAPVDARIPPKAFFAWIILLLVALASGYSTLRRHWMLLARVRKGLRNTIKRYFLRSPSFAPPANALMVYSPPPPSAPPLAQNHFVLPSAPSFSPDKEHWVRAKIIVVVLGLLSVKIEEVTSAGRIQEVFGARKVSRVGRVSEADRVFGEEGVSAAEEMPEVNEEPVVKEAGEAVEISRVEEMHGVSAVSEAEGVSMEGVEGAEDLPEVQEVVEVVEVMSDMGVFEVEETSAAGEVPEVQEVPVMGQVSEAEMEEMEDVRAVKGVPGAEEISEAEEVVVVNEMSEVSKVSEVQDMLDVKTMIGVEISAVNGLEEVSEVQEVSVVKGIEEMSDLPEVSVVKEKPESEEICELGDMQVPGISEVEAVEEVAEKTLPVSSSCTTKSVLDATTSPFVPAVSKPAKGLNPRAPPFTSTTSSIPKAVNSSLSLIADGSSSRRPSHPRPVMPNTTAANTVSGHNYIPRSAFGFPQYNPYWVPSNAVPASFFPMTGTPVPRLDSSDSAYGTARKPYRASYSTFIPTGWHARRGKSAFVPPSAPTTPSA